MPESLPVHVRVHDRYRLHTLAAALSLAALSCTSAHALSLGRAQVHSAQGSPLNITLPIIALSTQEQSSLDVRLAPAEAWAQAGLMPPAALHALRTRIEPGPAGMPDSESRRVLRVSSDLASDASTIDLLLTITTALGQRQVQFSVLTPAPGLSRPRVPTRAYVPSATHAGSAQQRAAPAPVAPTPTATAATGAAASASPDNAPTSASAAAPSNTALRGNTVVRRDQTLSGIAGGYPVDDATYYQMLVALWQANPDAFIENNMNLVREGERLTIPSADVVRAVDPAFAQRTYNEQLDAHARYRARMGAAAGTGRAVSSAPGDQGQVESAQAGSSAPAGSAQDRLRLSGQGVDAAGGVGGVAGAHGANSAGDSADRRTSENLALKDAVDRVNALERNVADLKAAEGSATSAGDGNAGGTGAGNGATATGAAAAAGSAAVGGNASGSATGNPGQVQSSANAANGTTGGSSTDGATSSSTPSNADRADDSNGSLMSASGLPAWLTDNLLIVMTAILAIIAFIIAWVVRRAAARREDQSDADNLDDEPSATLIDPALIDKRLQNIDLDLNNPPLDDKPSDNRRT